MMDLPTFEDHLDRHGADLTAWPPPLRREAERTIASSAEARAALAAMIDVEVLLREGRRVEPGSVDTTAIVAMRQPQKGRSRVYAVRTGWGVAAAMALFLGYSVGDIAPMEHEDSATQLMALALDAPGSADVD